MDSENKGSQNVKIMARNTQAFLISGRTGEKHVLYYRI